MDLCLNWGLLSVNIKIVYIMLNTGRIYYVENIGESEHTIHCTVCKSFAHRRKVKTLAVKNPTCSTWHCSVCLAFALFIVPLIQEWKYRKKRKVRHSFGPSNHIFVTAMCQSIFCKKTFSSLSTCFYGSALLMIKMCTKGS